ncbi:hypothetical protein [Sneathiella chinensis]|uniref:Uncharacterized protein n=1 Tax=Sneathiella chinensis TaxID=349750 RepID=A0ABQ5U393_9PROT|nr:hypothetical protein [Sneathiella chinensis]GLQ06181.1 hypothetical protein GCM10007924_14020 [Sneathiella chinensis]
MTEKTDLPEDVDRALQPRPNLRWADSQRFMSPWGKSVFIDNAASRRFWSELYHEEEEVRLLLRDHLEKRIAGCPSANIRFWLSEFDFMARLLPAEHMIHYAPSFVRLALGMPRKMVLCRRMAVRRYLDGRSPEKHRLMEREERKFIRASVLFYSGQRLFEMAEQFCGLMQVSGDQSRQASQRRVALYVRSLQLLTDEEICRWFISEDDYRTELEFLRDQCRYLKMTAAMIFGISRTRLTEFQKGE